MIVIQHNLFTSKAFLKTKIQNISVEENWQIASDQSSINVSLFFNLCIVCNRFVYYPF